MEGKPPVSCMCLTYGRPHLLEEAIESFLHQDYEGNKELIVFNDLADQELVFDHPEVHIINVGKRFATVGEKRNATAALCTHEILFVWDDDDIFLPWRITYSMEMFDPSRNFFKPSSAFVLNNGKLKGPDRNLFHSGGCWHRKLFNLVRGYAHIGSGQDLEIEQRMEKLHVGKGKNFNGIPLDKIYYLYRWQGTGSFHLSVFGKDKTGKIPGNDKVAHYVAAKLKNGEVPSGRIELNPHWKQDYVGLAAAYVAELRQGAHLITNAAQPI